MLQQPRHRPEWRPKYASYSTSSFLSPWTVTGWGWRPKNIEPADTCHLLDLIFFRQRTYWRIPLQKPLNELLSIFPGPKSLIPNPVTCFGVSYIPHADVLNFSVSRSACQAYHREPVDVPGGVSTPARCQRRTSIDLYHSHRARPMGALLISNRSGRYL
jgi:hypothetical protein